MDLKKFDDIKIPENLNEYIDKGLDKGERYMNSGYSDLNSRNNIRKDNRRLGKVASIILLASGISLIVASNIPTVANELKNIPFIGELVKILDFTEENTEEGGEITDGTEIVVENPKENTIDIYFKRDEGMAEDVPNYEIKYRKYPYGVEFRFNGVREFNVQKTSEELKKLPFVTDVYRLITLDDSAHRFVVEFSQNVDITISEYKNPGMIQVTGKEVVKEESKEKGYFIRSVATEGGESLAHMEEAFFREEGLSIQKDKNNKFIIQFGPYDSEDDAINRLGELKAKNPIANEFYVEIREKGQGPKVE